MPPHGAQDQRGGGSTRREAALVLLAAGLDALLSDAACEGVACVRTHAPQHFSQTMRLAAKACPQP